MRNGDSTPPDSYSKPSWPNAPCRRKVGPGIYFVTASTYNKAHHFCGNRRLSALHNGLLKYASSYGWTLDAWAVFPNHYHFVGHTATHPEDESFSDFFKELHSNSARWVNKLDNARGRKVWYNYFDTELTFQASYLARLKYVIFNAVNHGLVRVPNQYRWSSASWFEMRGDPAHVKKVYNFKIDRLDIYDDF